MEYKQIDKRSYKLHLIKTDKFKTITVRCIFKEKINKEEITIRNFLFEILLSSCKKYPSKRNFSIAKQELYDLNLYGNNTKIGNTFSTEISISMLENKYINDDITMKGLEFLKEVIFNPNLEDNKDFRNNFNITKNYLLSYIKQGYDYPKNYSYMRLKNLMGEDYSFSYNMDGNIKDLEEITLTSLQKYYDKFIKNSLIDIYVIGNINFYEMENAISKTFNFKKIKKDELSFKINYIPKSKKLIKYEESKNFNQTRLLISCYLKKLTEKERKYVMFLYNIILGASPDSFLFKNVRERKSLTYDILSNYRKSDNFLVISSGIDYTKCNEVIKGIKEEMNNIRKGKFSIEKLNNAKSLMISSLKEFDEYPSSIIDYYFSMEYLDCDNIETAIKEVLSVTKKDIVKVSKKINMDIIYVLKETKDERD